MRNGKRKSEDEKTLLQFLKDNRHTATKPLAFEPSVAITQVQNGTGYFDCVPVSVSKIWHIRETILMEMVGGQQMELSDCYDSSPDGNYYSDYWFQLKNLFELLKIQSLKSNKQ